MKRIKRTEAELRIKAGKSSYSYGNFLKTYNNLVQGTYLRNDVTKIMHTEK